MRARPQDQEIGAGIIRPLPTSRHEPAGRLTLVVLLCSAALLAPLALPLLRGRVFIYNDLSWFHLPLRHLYQQALEKGDSLLWTPAIFSGLYLHGEGQTGVFHPLHLLFYRLLPLRMAFNVELLTNYVGAFAGTWWLLRRLRFETVPALFGAMLIAFSGFMLLHHHHINMVAVVAHLPWLLAAADVLLVEDDRRTRRLAFAAVALLLGSQFLIGFPQGIWWNGLALTAFAAGRGLETGRWRAVLPLAAAMAIGVLLGGLQVLPSADAIAHSDRAALSPAFSLAYSLHPLNLLQFWSPHALVGGSYTADDHPWLHEFGIYSGALLPVALDLGLDAACGAGASPLADPLDHGVRGDPAGAGARPLRRPGAGAGLPAGGRLDAGAGPLHRPRAVRAGAPRGGGPRRSAGHPRRPRRARQAVAGALDSRAARHRHHGGPERAPAALRAPRGRQRRDGGSGRRRRRARHAARRPGGAPRALGGAAADRGHRGRPRPLRHRLRLHRPGHRHPAAAGRDQAGAAASGRQLRGGPGRRPVRQERAGPARLPPDDRLRRLLPGGAPSAQRLRIEAAGWHPVDVHAGGPAPAGRRRRGAGAAPRCGRTGGRRPRAADRWIGPGTSPRRCASRRP